jgi:ubiquinone/menaquinone biosynthesis C-methylase UbiE
MESLEFTGERYVPGQGGPQIAYEHLHRYLFAMRWARGQEVLDVAAGAGYGGSLLAKVACRVWELDLDRPALAHARAAYSDANLVFIQADATALPVRPAKMGLVVAFEVLEHVEDQESLVREAARVARSDGMVLISTPNKAVYSDARDYRNPFHTHEFYREEFLALLKRHFQHVHLVQQQVRAGSLIVPEGPSERDHEILVQPLPEEGATAVEPMYMLAVCTLDRPPVLPPAGSAYLDVADKLLGDWTHRLDDALQEIEKLNREVLKLGIWGRSLDEKVQDRDQVIRELQGKMAWEMAERDRMISNLQREFEERGRWALSLENDVKDRDDRILRTNAELSRVASHLARIRHAPLYRVLCRLGVLPK